MPIANAANLYGGRATRQSIVTSPHATLGRLMRLNYTEAEVNATLKAFHPDVAALRRYLVEEGLLDREGGEYWRSGGTFPVE